MDAGTTGRFIAECRRQKGYTQKELADRLMVSDKAVSRWETGKGLPDTSLLKPLADSLDVSVGELLSGQRMEETRMKEQTDRVILDALRYSGRTLTNAADLVLALIGAALLLSPLFVAGGNYIWLGGVVLIGAAAFRAYRKKGGKPMQLKETTLHAVSAALLLAALVLEALPLGAVLVFASGPAETVRHTYSYFDLTLVGYANFTPMLTGLLTGLAVILEIAALRGHGKTGKGKNAAFVCGALAAVLSLFPLLLFGGEYMTAVSYLITASIAASLCLQAAANRKPPRPA